MTDAPEFSPSFEVEFEDLRHCLADLKDHLPIFVITDHPADYPKAYVARLHMTLPVDLGLPLALADDNIDRLRTVMQALGLVRLERAPCDDPVIVETWL